MNLDYVRAILAATEPSEQRIRAAKACLEAAGQTPLVQASHALMDEALNELLRMRERVDPLGEVAHADRRRAEQEQDAAEEDAEWT